MTSIHWKIRLVPAIISIVLATQMVQCSFAFGQANQLRPLHDKAQSQNTPPTTDVPEATFNIEPKVVELGASVFKDGEPQTFASTLSLPEVSKLSKETPRILHGANRIEISSIVAQVAQATVIVVLFCIVAMFLLKKFRAERFFASSTSGQSSTTSPIQLLGTIRLAGNRSLELIETDGKRLVVLSGSGEASSLLLLDGTAEEAVSNTKASKPAPVFSLPFDKDARPAQFVRQSL